MQTQQTQKSRVWRTWDWLDERYKLTQLMDASGGHHRGPRGC